MGDYSNLSDGDAVTVEESCKKHGPYTVESRMLFGKPLFVSCPVCAQEDQQRRKEQEQQQVEAHKRGRIKTLSQNSGIPKRFADSVFDHFEADTDDKRRVLATCRKYADSFEDRLAMGGGLVLCGKPGTGKTLLACSIANQIIRENLRAPVFTSVTKLARAVKDTYRKGSELTEQQAITGFVEPDLLIIDEIGAQRGTETELLIMQEIIE